MTVPNVVRFVLGLSAVYVLVGLPVFYFLAYLLKSNQGAPSYKDTAFGCMTKGLLFLYFWIWVHMVGCLLIYIVFPIIYSNMFIGIPLTAITGLPGVRYGVRLDKKARRNAASDDTDDDK